MTMKERALAMNGAVIERATELGSDVLLRMGEVICTHCERPTIMHEFDNEDNTCNVTVATVLLEFSEVGIVPVQPVSATSRPIPEFRPMVPFAA